VIIQKAAAIGRPAFFHHYNQLIKDCIHFRMLHSTGAIVPMKHPPLPDTVVPPSEEVDSKLTLIPGGGGGCSASLRALKALLTSLTDLAVK
jgi:hypothetical protein